MTLEEKRKQWEGESKVLTTIKIPEIVSGIDMGSVLVVTEDNYNPDRYRCIRYFPIVQFDDGKVDVSNWEVSVDGDSVELSTVWKWLENPTARTCYNEKVA